MTLAVPLSPDRPRPDSGVPAAAGDRRTHPRQQAMWVGIFCEITEFALLFASSSPAPTRNLPGGPCLSLLAGTRL